MLKALVANSTRCWPILRVRFRQTNLSRGVSDTGPINCILSWCTKPWLPAPRREIHRCPSAHDAVHEGADRPRPVFGMNNKRGGDGYVGRAKLYSEFDVKFIVPVNNPPIDAATNIIINAEFSLPKDPCLYCFPRAFPQRTVFATTWPG